MNPLDEFNTLNTRRHFLNTGARGLGALAAASLMNPGLLQGGLAPSTAGGGTLGRLHFAPKAKRVIYLFFSGGPSHIDMYDYHPAMRKNHGIELPDSIRNGQRLTGMTSGQKSFPCVAPMFDFSRCGQHGTWVSELLPNIAKIVDDIVDKSVHTEAINHDPAITCINTGTHQPIPNLAHGWTGDLAVLTKIFLACGDDSKVEANLKHFMTVYGAVDFFPLSIRVSNSAASVTRFCICLTHLE